MFFGTSLASEKSLNYKAHKWIKKCNWKFEAYEFPMNITIFYLILKDFYRLWQELNAFEHENYQFFVIPRFQPNCINKKSIYNFRCLTNLSLLQRDLMLKLTTLSLLPLQKFLANVSNFENFYNNLSTAAILEN